MTNGLSEKKNYTGENGLKILVELFFDVPTRGHNELNSEMKILFSFNKIRIKN